MRREEKKREEKIEEGGKGEEWEGGKCLFNTLTCVGHSTCITTPILCSYLKEGSS